MDKRFLYLRQALLMFVFSLLTFSCSDELHMQFPEGPQGPAGLSAYEVWVKAVYDGEVDWPKDRTDINNFFLFLKGKDGVNGVDGLDGKSAYEIWKEQVAQGIEDPHNPGNEWPKDHDSLQDFWHYLSGADGQDGATPKIGDNGNWYINGEDTGIPARGKDGADGADGKDGKDGKDAVAPTVEIGSNGNWYINGEDTGVPARGKDGSNGADGKDGKTPTITIGDNGNWFVDGEDTGVPATGPKGADGKDGTNGSNGADGKDGNDGKNGTQFCIGENGNWWIFNEETGKWEDTGKPSKGADGTNGNNGTNGTNGSNGLSAYELWVIAVGEGLENPHSKTEPKENWPKDKTSMADFWEYLRGSDGKNGESDIGTLVEDYILTFKHIRSTHTDNEYDPETGDVYITIKDRNEKPLRKGTQVTFEDYFGLSEGKTYSVDENSNIKIDCKDLPKNGMYYAQRSGRASVDIGDGNYYMTNIFTMPTQVKVRQQILRHSGFASGVYRMGYTICYVADAAGATAQVEYNNMPVAYWMAAHFDYDGGYNFEANKLWVHEEWYAGETDDSKKLTKRIPQLEVCDRDGTNGDPDDWRVSETFNRSYGTASAWRQYKKEDANDYQRPVTQNGYLGYHFEKSNRYANADEPYYVKFKYWEHWFGLGEIPTEVYEIPVIGRVPLIESLRWIDDGKKVEVTFNSDKVYLNGGFWGADQGMYQDDDNIWHWRFREMDYQNDSSLPNYSYWTLYATFTSKNVHFSNESYDRANRTAVVDVLGADLEGITIYLTALSKCVTGNAAQNALVPHSDSSLRPVTMGVFVKENGKTRLKVDKGVSGNDNTYIDITD